MLKNILLLPILIVGFALCEEKNQEKIDEYKKIYKKALLVVQTNKTLKLVKVTHTLRGSVAACMLSDFISNETDAAIRTLERKHDGSEPPMKVYIALDHSTKLPVRPKLQIHGIGGDVPPGWDEIEYIKHAEEDCLILQPLNFLQGDLPCLLWAFDVKNKCTTEYQRQCTEASVEANMEKCVWKD